jgi:hypothetical protein
MTGSTAISGKITNTLNLTKEQQDELEKRTGVRMAALLVETEPSNNSMFTRPRTNVVARVKARFQ